MRPDIVPSSHSSHTSHSHLIEIVFFSIVGLFFAVLLFVFFMLATVARQDTDKSAPKAVTPVRSGDLSVIEIQERKAPEN